MAAWRALLEAMSMRRGRRIGLSEADRLVAGDRTDPALEDLSGLLDAARAPATERELAGERAAIAGFRAARPQLVLATASVGTRRRVPRSVTASAIRVVAGVAVLAIGGTAAAARTGNLPTAAQEKAHALFSQVGVPAPEASPIPSPGGEASGEPTAAVPSPSLSRSPDPTPSVRGSVSPEPTALLTLCQVWDDAQRDPGGKAVPTETRRSLAAAAGGMPRITAFCADLLQPSATPSRSAPTSNPSPSTSTKSNGRGNGSVKKTKKPTPQPSKSKK